MLAHPPSCLRGAENWGSRLLASAGVIPEGKTLSPGKMTPRAMVTLGRESGRPRRRCDAQAPVALRLLCATGAKPKTCSVLSGNIWKMDEREHLGHLL